MTEDHTHLAVESANQDFSVATAIAAIIFVSLVFLDAPTIILIIVAQMLVLYSASILAIRTMHRLGWL